MSLKIGKMILMLSSANDGEVVAAARAIGRALAADGKDWHWLAERLRSTEPAQQTVRKKPMTEDPTISLDEVRDMVEALIPQMRRMSRREGAFLEDMSFRLNHYRHALISERQREFIKTLYNRYC